MLKSMELSGSPIFIGNALRDAEAEQTRPIKPKSEAQLEADRSAAAIALNAAYLRERESRYGKAVRRVTTADVLAEALKDAGATQDEE
jgi:hypothetical protein